MEGSLKSLEAFTLLKNLGAGSFGDVILAKSKEQQKLYALKKVNKQRIAKVKQF